MIVIQQGDQYYIPFKIKMGDSYTSPSNVDDMIIKIGTIEKSYSNNELEYDADNNAWLYYLTRFQSQQQLGNTEFQCKIVIGDVKRLSQVMTINTYRSIIKEDPL